MTPTLPPLPTLPATEWLLHMPAQPHEPEWTSSQEGYQAEDMQSYATAYGEQCARAAVARKFPTVDEIAQFIRATDGNHQMGAGALAEKLHEWLAATPPAVEARVPDEHELQKFKNMLSRYEHQWHRMGELWERRQGKGWPEKEATEFNKLRDELTPDTRKQLISMLSAAPAAPGPQEEPVAHKFTVKGCTFINSKKDQQEPQDVPKGECFKTGSVCAKCGHDEFISAAALGQQDVPLTCCEKYESCTNACTPRGRFLGMREAQQASAPADILTLARAVIKAREVYGWSVEADAAIRAMEIGLQPVATQAVDEQPIFWYRPVGEDGLYEGPVHNNSVGGRMLRDEKPDEWVPLFAGRAALNKQEG